MNRGGFVFLFGLAIRSVDPNRLGKTLWFGDSLNESFRGLLPSSLKCFFARRQNFFRLSVVQRCRRHHADSTVIMFVVVPVKEEATESQCVFVAAKTLREIGTLFHRFELALGEWIVVGQMRTTVAFGDAQ